jgi:hypothetical protein
MRKRHLIKTPSSSSAVDPALADEYAKLLRLREMVARLEKKRGKKRCVAKRSQSPRAGIDF